MSMFNDILWWSEDNERECNANADLVSKNSKKIPSKTMVIPRTWITNKVVFYLQRKTKRRMDIVAELTMIKFGESGHPVFRATSPLSRGTLKSKGGGKLSINFCADGDTIETASHNYFCKSAQYLRTSLRFVWGIQYLSNTYGETRIGTWDSCTRKLITEIQGMSGKASTTRSIDKSWYWCKLPDTSWNRTVFHDTGHWRVLTIYRANGMSWVYFVTRRKINWPETLDSREHQDWTRIGSYNLLPTR